MKHFADKGNEYFRMQKMFHFLACSNTKYALFRKKWGRQDCLQFEEQKLEEYEVF